ncbi:hypothetical protein C8C79_11548 [Halanaerobium congolense]|nr:hypothetical protein C8C79_11548 [Halanaerobium congolense]
MQLMSAIIFIKLVESATKLKRGVIMRVSAPIGKWIAKLYKDHDQFVDNLLEDYNLIDPPRGKPSRIPAS